jgi:hypothetical protein
MDFTAAHAETLRLMPEYRWPKNGILPDGSRAMLTLGRLLVMVASAYTSVVAGPKAFLASMLLRSNPATPEMSVCHACEIQTLQAYVDSVDRLPPPFAVMLAELSVLTLDTTSVHLDWLRCCRLSQVPITTEEWQEWMSGRTKLAPTPSLMTLRVRSGTQAKGSNNGSKAKDTPKGPKGPKGKEGF